MKKLTIFVIFINLSVLIFGQSRVFNFAEGTKTLNCMPLYSELYKSITFDGGWGESFNNQAIYFEGKFQRTYSFWIDMFGDLAIGYFDNQSKEVRSSVIIDNQKIKIENATVSMLFRPDGKLIVFYVDKSKSSEIQTFTMSNTEDIFNWEKQTISISNSISIQSLQPFLLTSEKNKVYVFIKNSSDEISYLTSTDLGISWTKPMPFITANQIKFASNNVNRIAFAINNSSFFYYTNDKLFDLNDAEISKLGVTTIDKNKFTVISNSNSTITDIALNVKNQIVAVSTKSDFDGGFYSIWENKNWTIKPLEIGKISGEIYIDKESPTTVYYSSAKETISEISKATLQKNGKDWKIEAITNGSPRNNNNPFPIMNANEKSIVQVCWIQEALKYTKINQQSTIKINTTVPEIKNIFEKTDITNLMNNVIDWQLSNPFSDKQKNDWHWGAFYMGLEAAYDATGNECYLNDLMNVGQYFEWGYLPDVLHADRLIVGDIYSYLYEKKKDPEMLKQTKWVFDLHLSRKAKPDVTHDKNPYKYEWWSWCDALYMAPPSFYRYAKVTNQPEYAEYAYKHWKITTDYLYSKEDSLSFRDDNYFKTKSKNGQKVLWSRGNGWVIGGITRILNTLPPNHPHRAYYEKQFKEMAAKILPLQLSDGMWTMSLLDPQENPQGESSGTAFFGYAFAWGINNGLLDKKTYEPATRKAWTALCGNVGNYGRLGNVQQTAGAPTQFFPYHSNVYASGTFLLFGNEILKLIK